MKQEIIATLEALCGIAEATQIDNVVILFTFLMDFLNNCIGLMDIYKNTPETINLIIEVFVEVAHKQICYLGEVSKTSMTYFACILMCWKFLPLTNCMLNNLPLLLLMFSPSKEKLVFDYGIGGSSIILWCHNS